MQLNIWNGRLMQRIIELIESERPDIICMQEVFHGEVTVISLEQQFNNLRILQKASGLENSFFSPTGGYKLNGYQVDMGNAIFSKFPLLDPQTVFTAGAYTAEVDVLKPFPNLRNLQIVRIELDGRNLTLANHHGYWQPDPMGNEDTVRSFQIAAEALRPVQGPLIFAADLNVIPESPAMRAFDFLEDLTASHQLSTTLSELGKVANVPCDHILISPEIKVQTFYVSDKLVSDHKALVLEFEL